MTTTGITSTATARCSLQQVSLEGFSAWRLENTKLRVDILPELGGKIWNFEDKQTGEQWIWHNPNQALAKARPQHSYDAQWAGGWEELFPNDSPTDIHGNPSLLDHGEWWQRSWQVVASTGGSADLLTLRLDCNSAPAVCKKSFWMDNDSLYIRYCIENKSKTTLPYLFKLHAAMQVSPQHTVLLPGGQIHPVDLEFSKIITEQGPHPWPGNSGKRGFDLSQIPPASARSQEFVYVSDLPEGWCGLESHTTGRRFVVHYPQEVFPYVWLFMTYGGWQDSYTLVLEPCTNMPKHLHDAYRLGQCALLQPGETLDCSVKVELQ